MFGYVRAREDLLSREDRARYEAAYCGVCRTMGERYGYVARMFLNYDFAFLAMVLAPQGQACVASCKRCVSHPIEGRSVCQGGPWLETAAGESVILTYWKLRDSVWDSGFFTGLPARFLSLCLGPAYRKAKSAYPEFDRQIIPLLEELRGLEREGCTSIDQTADCFSRLLRAAAPETGEKDRDRVLDQLLGHLGRWIYLIDAVDDIAEDRRAGRYNPVLARFPQWTEEDKTYLRHSLEHTRALMGAAFQLLEPNAWTGATENIIYSGLPGVEELVFAGQWRQRQRKGRRGGT